MADKPTPAPRPLLPVVAEAMAELFPDLGGRSVAVSEAEITKENIPTLPVCMVALVRMDAVKWAWNAASASRELFDDFMIEFWLAPVKYTRADGSESPFWAFYDYEGFRDVVLSWATGFVGPRGQRLEFRDMGLESTTLAVVLSFRFRAHYNWCRTDDEETPLVIGKDAKITHDMRPPRGLCCPEPCEEPKENCACSSP